MSLSYSTGFVHAILNASGFKETFTNCVIDIYSGTRPTDANSAIGSVTKLGRVTVSGGAFSDGVATNGLNFASPADRAIDKASGEVWQFTGLANGTATWFRIRGNAADNELSSTSLPRIDGTIAAFGGDVTLSNTSIVSGNIYTFNQCKLAWPAA